MGASQSSSSEKPKETSLLPTPSAAVYGGKSAKRSAKRSNKRSAKRSNKRSNKRSAKRSKRMSKRGMRGK